MVGFISSVYHQVIFELVPAVKHTITDLTFIELLSPLFCSHSSLACSQVTFEGTISSKSFMTIWTFKRFFTCMFSKMLFKMSKVVKLLLTVLTYVYFFPSSLLLTDSTFFKVVTTEVLFPCALPKIPFIAYFTLETLSGV